MRMQVQVNGRGVTFFIAFLLQFELDLKQQFCPFGTIYRLHFHYNKKCVPESMFEHMSKSSLLSI